MWGTARVSTRLASTGEPLSKAAQRFLAAHAQTSALGCIMPTNSLLEKSIRCAQLGDTQATNLGISGWLVDGETSDYCESAVTVVLFIRGTPAREISVETSQMEHDSSV